MLAESQAHSASPRFVSMDPFDECSVLLPAATLEEFPVGGSDSDARSLLAGWTVLWHPKLIAQTEQIPTWYRADAPPTPDGPRVIVVPEPSLSQIPADFRRKCEANPSCVWVTGADRSDMRSVLGLSDDIPQCEPLEFSGRELSVDDFFAVGYLALQIQIMTRRLRYTSNLDELHLQSCVTAAAKAFCDRDAESTAQSLHDVFDCLAEERDHYFSSDPHLIDLTLLTSSVLDAAAASGWLERFAASALADDSSNGVLGLSRNLLIDGALAGRLADADDASVVNQREQLRELIQLESVGWAGGGTPHNRLDANGILDSLTIARAASGFCIGTELAEKAIGSPPSVFAQLDGVLPVDLVCSLATLGYEGVIPINFAAGTGFGDESKVLVSAGGCELEALTAKPIDAASDAAFLSIGAQLGEMIDTGEVATGLLVHWPDRVCDSFLDLCRCATWCVALGKFWRIDDYFTGGERPYHHGSLDTLCPTAANELAKQLDKDQTVQSWAESFLGMVQDESQRVTQSIAQLAKPDLLDQPHLDSHDVAAPLAEMLGLKLEENNIGPSSLCFNPHCVAARGQTQLSAGSPAAEKFVYAATAAAGQACDITFDVPAMGFTRLSATESVSGPGIWKRLTRRNQGIADKTVLKNEFMAVSLDEATGGIEGVYSASRGNRLSMRLIAAEDFSGTQAGGAMVCESFQTDLSNLSIGQIRSSGCLKNESGDPIAKFEMTYTLRRGSRILDIEGTLTPSRQAENSGASSFWKNYLAIRTAVAGEACIVRPLVRDKVHTNSSRRLVAPLGVVIDEAEKQTLLVGYGLPLHRRVGDRFVDTIVADTRHAPVDEPIPFRLSYAFDATNPVALARSCLVPPKQYSVVSDGDLKTEQAWLVHLSAREVAVTEMTLQRRQDGKLAARLMLVQTRPKTSQVRLQFCTFAVAAFVAGQSGIDRELDDLPQDIEIDDGTVSLTLGSHQVIDLVVVFEI